MINFNYSYLSKLFHKFTLNSNQRLKVLFEIEKKFYLKSANKYYSSLFITGLPRSGSTILLNSLYKTNLFSSLQYSDMPLITSPNLWSKINFFKKKIERQERAHNDGININYESPEAFEEIFWRSQLNISYKDKIIFDKNLYSTEIAEEFKKFIKLINFKNKKNIYLSKNNSNIIRIKFLLNNLEKKKILILFRNPIDQCISMLTQHHNFLFLQKSDKFVLQYMNMLSHYEFGKNHKPAFLSQYNSSYDPNNINYWLEYWIMVYSKILENIGHKDLKFLSFETLNQFPDKVIVNILNSLKIININSKSFKNEIKNIKKKKFDHLQIDKNVLINADNLYKEMKINEIKI